MDISKTKARDSRSGSFRARGQGRDRPLRSNLAAWLDFRILEAAFLQMQQGSCVSACAGKRVYQTRHARQSGTKKNSMSSILNTEGGMVDGVKNNNKKKLN